MKFPAIIRWPKRNFEKIIFYLLVGILIVVSIVVLFSSDRRQKELAVFEDELKRLRDKEGNPEPINSNLYAKDLTACLVNKPFSYYRLIYTRNVFVLLQAFVPPVQKTAEEYFEEAKGYFPGGNLEQAKELLSKALQMRPGYQEAQQLLEKISEEVKVRELLKAAKQALAGNDLDKAEILAKEVKALRPDSKEADDILEEIEDKLRPKLKIMYFGEVDNKPVAGIQDLRTEKKYRAVREGDLIEEWKILKIDVAKKEITVKKEGYSEQIIRMGG